MPKQPLTECHVIHTAVQLERRLIPAINPPPRTSSSQQCATSTAPERHSRGTKVCSQHVTAARRQRRTEVYRSLTNTTRLTAHKADSIATFQYSKTSQEPLTRYHDDCHQHWRVVHSTCTLCIRQTRLSNL